MLSLIFQPGVVSYVQSKNIQQLHVTVNLHEEPCTQIYSPKIIPIVKETDKKNIAKDAFTISSNGLKVFFSPEFVQKFAPEGEINFQLKGLLKKRIEITNIDPIITNTCKVDYSKK
ncbi:MAG: hypothetical protein ACTSYI_15900 [Promethearchaeota archaeon]